MRKIEEKRLCIIGDIHGELPLIVYRIVEELGLRDTAFIIAGDVGLGFEKPGYYENIYNRIKGRLEKSGNVIYGIRGNHDDPAYFGGSCTLDFPRFKTLSDYEFIDWGGHSILCIGGAQSIDMDQRLKYNSEKESSGSSKRCWWPGELVIKKEDKELEKMSRPEIIISHEAPLGIGPVINRPRGISDEIFENILDTRRYLSRVLRIMMPQRWYFGHYHETYSGSQGETLYRGLDINEVIEVIL